MTENVILADEEMIRTYFEASDYHYQGDGNNGAHLLGELSKKHKKQTYKKTYDGIILLKKLNLSRAAAKSVAASKLLNALTIPCWWTGIQQ